MMDSSCCSELAFADVLSAISDQPALGFRLRELLRFGSHLIKQGEAELDEDKFVALFSDLVVGLRRLLGLGTEESLLLDPPLLASAAYELILNAQVLLDEIAHPQIDPTLGWIEREHMEDEGGTRLVIDSQLMHLNLRGQGAGEILSWDYKPRRISLAAQSYAHLGACAEAALPAFSEGIFQLDGHIPQSVEDAASLFAKMQKIACNEEAALPKIITATPGLLRLRFRKEPSAGIPLGARYLCFKDLSIKAGVGAYRNYATTGFEVEYMLEQVERAEKSLFVLQLSLCFPSMSMQALALQRLLCMGGVQAEEIEIKGPYWFATESAPGGLYGLRISDRLADFEIDFRFSRALHGAALLPLSFGAGVAEDAGGFEAFSVLFCLPVSRLLGPRAEGLSFFLSIM